jgi:hypothetical protein
MGLTYLWIHIIQQIIFIDNNFKIDYSIILRDLNKKPSNKIESVIDSILLYN